MRHFIIVGMPASGRNIVRDLREIEYGTAHPIAMADEYILNTGTGDDALKDLGRIMEKYGRR